MSAEEEAKKLRRLRRFEDERSQFKAENVTTPPTPMVNQQCIFINKAYKLNITIFNQDGAAFENQTVVGTSTKLEKQYLRLTSVSTNGKG